jgi:hypothetical protein
MLRAVIKAGGSRGVDRDAVATLVSDVARQDEIVLVHGASAETDRIAGALGVPQETITSPSGHTSRRTDRRTLEVFAMAALGVENFLYVEKLQQRGVDAVGLSGLSGRLLVGKRKDVRAVKNGKTILLRDDYTGTVEAVNLPLLTQFRSSRHSRSPPRTRRSTSMATASRRASPSRSTPMRCSSSPTSPVSCATSTTRRRSWPRPRSRRPSASRRAA